MTGNSDLKIGALLLAAGGSSRLGQPKQLLKFKGRSLVRRAAEALVGSGCEPVVVVLGAEIERSTDEIAGLSLTICVNEEWQTGMSSSIKAGLRELLNIEPGLDAVLITLCDQPNVTADMLRRFLSQFRLDRASIIAAHYGETVGVPALFSSELFDELFQLEGDKGARDLIRRQNGVQTINLESAAFDIDTSNDVKSFDLNKSS